MGSWHALWELMDKDEAGNAVQGDTLLIDARDNLVRSEKRVVALAGVEGLAVIETADAVLVARREMGEAVRGVVDRLVAGRRKEATVHAREVRPWGTFLVLQEGPGFKVKEVTVDPRLPAHAPVPPRPRRALGHRRRECRGRAGRGAAPARPRPERPRPARPAAPAWPTPTARRCSLIEIGYGEALGDEDTVRLEA